jgi:hypothetical protein
MGLNIMRKGRAYAQTRIFLEDMQDRVFVMRTGAIKSRSGIGYFLQESVALIGSPRRGVRPAIIYLRIVIFNVGDLEQIVPLRH